MRGLRWIVVVVVLSAVGGCASLGAPRPKPPTLDEIVEMSKAGTPPEEIIKRLEDSYAVYRLSAADVVKLHEQGVSDKVLDYMHEEELREIRRDEAFRAYHYYGWPYYWGPYNAWPPPHYRHRRW
jgi:hypothetical protein